MSNHTTLTIPITGTPSVPSLVGFSPVDEMLSKALSDSVASMFSSKVPLPFSDVRIQSVPQETHPIPSKWQVDVAIDDEGVFDATTTTSNVTSSRQSSAAQSTEPTAVLPGSRWNGSKFFEGALLRLGLERNALNRLLDGEASIVDKFGRSGDELARIKKSIKNELKDYDTVFRTETGRDPARADKEPMRLLYSLYRKLRDLIGKGEDASPTAAQPSVVPAPQVLTGGQHRGDLENKLEALYQEKQAIRHILQEYQARFMAEQGRRIKYHRDIVAVDREYRQYKTIKEEIGKLELQLGRTPTINKNSNDLFN